MGSAAQSGCAHHRSLISHISFASENKTRPSQKSQERSVTGCAKDDALDSRVLGAVARRETSAELVADVAERATAAHERNAAGHGCDR